MYNARSYKIIQNMEWEKKENGKWVTFSFSPVFSSSVLLLLGRRILFSFKGHKFLFLHFLWVRERERESSGFVYCVVCGERELKSRKREKVERDYESGRFVCCVVCGEREN